MIFQAYALLSEYMGNLSDMESIKCILYDDNCYLGKFAENEERAAKNKEDDVPSEYFCDRCGSRFQKEGNLRIHMVAKHKGDDHILVKEGQNLTLEDKQKGRVCQFCEQPFGSNLALENHITKKHKTCSICKTTFSEPKDMELEKCRAKHTTCEICNFDAKFPSKLKRHMQSHA